jgi:hypothetical protein
MLQNLSSKEHQCMGTITYQRLTEITHFFLTMLTRIGLTITKGSRPCQPIFLIYPGDYRTKDEIKKGIAEANRFKKDKASQIEP